MFMPNSYKEYNELFLRNYIAEGTKVHLPCPFCAAPWFMIYDIRDILAQNSSCFSCGRSGKFVVDKDSFSSEFYEFVQTGGKEPPKWLSPSFRKVMT